VSTLVYVDTSALVKLVFDEPESSALATFLENLPDRVCSAVASVELGRVARSVQDPAVDRDAKRVLKGVHLIAVDAVLLAAAATTEPRSLKTLDAIHLATARSLGHELAGVITYDRRLADAARDHDLTVWSPA
jgi:predicted nucleic acid-binding protein